MFEVEVVEVCSYCLADTGLNPTAKYVLISKPSDVTPRSVAHLICWQSAMTASRRDEGLPVGDPGA